MKKIVGFNNKGGMILKAKWKCCDKELIELVGEDGVKQIMRDLQEAKRERANGFMGYPAEDVSKELDDIINEAIIQQYGI